MHPRPLVAVRVEDICGWLHPHSRDPIRWKNIYSVMWYHQQTLQNLDAVHSLPGPDHLFLFENNAVSFYLNLHQNHRKYVAYGLLFAASLSNLAQTTLHSISTIFSSGTRY